MNFFIANRLVNRLVKAVTVLTFFPLDFNLWEAVKHVMLHKLKTKMNALYIKHYMTGQYNVGSTCNSFAVKVTQRAKKEHAGV